jgi:CheY-like chemotaxis protein
MNDTPMRILLVEDNSLDVRLLREMLSNQALREFSLIEVGYMSEAEKYLAANKVDIILLDLGLPDARAMEALRRAHAAAPRIPLVVLTGCDDELMADQALREGCPGFSGQRPNRDASAAPGHSLCHAACEGRC